MVEPGLGAAFTPNDERAHEPDPSEPTWQEWWSFDFASSASALGGFVRLAFEPSERTAWYWAYLVVPEVGVVVVRDHDVPLPRRASSLEVRADGLWAELVCETAFEHWGTRLEAFGLRLDDPLDTADGEIGERFPVGLDLEWELSAPPVAAQGSGGYTQRGTVHGALLLDDERVEIDTGSVREHGWGAWPPAQLESPRADAGADMIAAVRIPLGPTQSLVRSLVRSPGAAGWSDRFEGPA
jgi:hypothetical protein